MTSQLKILHCYNSLEGTDAIFKRYQHWMSRLWHKKYSICIIISPLKRQQQPVFSDQTRSDQKLLLLYPFSKLDHAGCQKQPDKVRTKCHFNFSALKNYFKCNSQWNLATAHCLYIRHWLCTVASRAKPNLCISDERGSHEILSPLMRFSVETALC